MQEDCAFMTKEEQTNIRLFETRVRQLILEFNTLKKKYSELSTVINEKDIAINRLKDENEQLKTEYANLKMAKMIEINDSDMKNAKSRLAKLVRDVDKCIALLNV